MGTDIIICEKGKTQLVLVQGRKLETTIMLANYDSSQLTATA